MKCQSRHAWDSSSMRWWKLTVSYVSYQGLNWVWAKILHYFGLWIWLFFLKMGYPHCRMVFRRALSKGPWAGQTLTRSLPVFENKRIKLFFIFLTFLCVIVVTFFCWICWKLNSSEWQKIWYWRDAQITTKILVHFPASLMVWNQTYELKQFVDPKSRNSLL